jgi:hypothetical protein
MSKKVIATCPHCGRKFQMGYTGTVDGCDSCTGVERDQEMIWKLIPPAIIAALCALFWAGLLSLLKLPAGIVWGVAALAFVVMFPTIIAMQINKVCNG